MFFSNIGEYVKRVKQFGAHEYVNRNVPQLSFSRPANNVEMYEDLSNEAC